jgi:hypothetical protein
LGKCEFLVYKKDIVQKELPLLRNKKIEKEKKTELGKLGFRV